MKIGMYSKTPRSGKSTVVEYFLKNGGFKKESFADSVKYSLYWVLVDLGIDSDEVNEYLYGDKKDHYIEEVGCTGGYLMSTYAMFMRNTFGKDIWLNTTLIRMSPDRNYIIDDMRFPNEFEIFDITIKVVRPDAVEEHGRDSASEGQLDDYDFDYIIVNDGTKEDLKEKVATLYKVITGDKWENPYG